MSRRRRILVILLVALLIEAALGFYLLRVPPDGLGMRRILARVVNSSREEDFLRQKSPAQVVGISQRDLDTLMPLVEPLVSEASGMVKALILRDWVSRNLRVSQSTPPHLSVSDLIAGIKGPEEPPAVWCDAYAKIFFLAARAVGAEARIVHLSGGPQRALQAHYANEVWVPRLSKWVYVDGFFNLHIEIDGRPASALEIHKAAFSLAAAEKIIIKRGRFSRDEFLPQKYLDLFQHLQIVGGPVFSSGRGLLLKNKQVLFYNLVDKISPPLRRGARLSIFLFKYLLPLLILIFVILFISTYRRGRRYRVRRPREPLPFILPRQRKE
jgi:hypothetical protein